MIQHSHGKWPIEIDGVPNFKMVDLSMAMLNNQMVIYIYIYYILFLLYKLYYMYIHIYMYKIYLNQQRRRVKRFKTAEALSSHI